MGALDQTFTAADPGRDTSCSVWAREGFGHAVPGPVFCLLWFTKTCSQIPSQCRVALPVPSNCFIPMTLNGHSGAGSDSGHYPSVPAQSQLIPIFREVSDTQSWIWSNTPAALLLSGAVRQALAARFYSRGPWKTLITHSLLVHAELSACTAPLQEDAIFSEKAGIFVHVAHRNCHYQ